MHPGARTDVRPPLRFTLPELRLGFGAWAVGGAGWGAPGAERDRAAAVERAVRSEEHTSELQSPCNLVCRLLLEKKKNKNATNPAPTWSDHTSKSHTNECESGVK